MAADDKFIKAGYGTATTLSAPGYTSGVSTTVNVASTATWPTTTDVIFAIDEAEVVDGEEQRVDGTYNVFQGTVDTATSIIDVDYIGGDAERSFSAGALTRVYILSSSYLHNRTIDGILVHADQDGTLKAGAVDNAGVLASDVVTTAKILDANVTSAKLAAGAATSEKQGSTISFHAYRNAAFNVTSAAAAVALDTEVYDTGADFDTSTGKFVAPVAGVYHFDGRVAFGSGDRRASVFIYVNGSPALLGSSTVNTFAASTASGSIKLAANDEVQLFAQSDTTVAGITGQTAAYLTGHFVGVA